MSEFHLKRRIPPMSLDEIVEQLLDDTSVNVLDAREIAKELYAANMEVIYRLARVGETFERLQECPPDHATDFWRGYAAGWNGARQWVIDNPQ